VSVGSAVGITVGKGVSVGLAVVVGSGAALVGVAVGCGLVAVAAGVGLAFSAHAGSARMMDNKVNREKILDFIFFTPSFR